MECSVYSVNAVWSKSCIRPLPSIKISFYEDELMSAPNIITVLPNLRLGNEKVPCILSKIIYPE